jgi:hypothetical protein
MQQTLMTLHLLMVKKLVYFGISIKELRLVKLPLMNLLFLMAKN